MKRKFILKAFKIIILALGIVYIWNIAPHSMVWAGLKSKFVDTTQDLDIREGDFIFQNIHGKLFSVIEDVTGSPITHCGIIVKKKGEWYVLEAIGPVMFTSLNEWIHRGIGSEITIVRLKDKYQNQIPRIIKASYNYLDRPYDIQYEWDDEKIYCSELIYKAVRDATGMELVEFRRLGDMKWEPHEAFIRMIAGGILPLDRKMIAPGDLVMSEKVEIVYNNFREDKK
jgi:hypothetical protein